MRSYLLLLATFISLTIGAQDDDPTERFFFKLDYGVTIPVGPFAEFTELSDGYAILGHGGSLSGGLHLNERWSVAIAVHNTLNGIDRVNSYDFNDQKNYQILQVSFEPYFKFRTYPSVLYLKPVVGIGSRASPWYRISRSEEFLDQYIFVSPKSRIGLAYGLGGGFMFKTKYKTRLMMEAQLTNTSATFEVYQGDILTGIREDIRKSMTLLSLKLGVFLSN